MKATKEEVLTVAKFAIISHQPTFLSRVGDYVDSLLRADKGTLHMKILSCGTILLSLDEMAPSLELGYGLYCKMYCGDVVKEVRPETVGIWYELMPNLSKLTTEDKKLLDKVTRLIKQGRFDEAKNAVMVSKL